VGGGTVGHPPRRREDVGSTRCRFSCDAFPLAMFCQAAARSRPTAASSALSRGEGLSRVREGAFR
jgi:hypothetical protein